MAFTSLSSSTTNVVYRLGGEKHQRFIKLFLAWKSVVGELMAERSYPLKIERNTLFVGVQNSAWMQELNLLKPKIIKKYKNKYAEELAEIIFVINTPKKRKA